MIVVRANLYGGHAEKARRKRPKMRIAVVAGVLLCALFVFDFTRSRAVAGLRQQLATSEAQAAGLARDIEAAAAREVELRSGTARRDAVLAFASQRTNWASVLARTFAALPPTVELTRLEVTASEPQRPIARFAGRAMGAEPRLEADKCMLQITHAFSSAGVPMTGQFVMLEDSRAARIGADNRRGVAEFVMQFRAKGGGRED